MTTWGWNGAETHSIRIPRPASLFAFLAYFLGRTGAMKIRLWLLLSLFVTAATWLYVYRILGPWRHYVNVEIGTMKADLGDLYTPWVASRELLIYKRNPYSPEVTR